MMKTLFAGLGVALLSSSDALAQPTQPADPKCKSPTHGTNSMFAGLPNYKFTGTVDWQTGRIDGSIAAREQAPAPLPPARASTALAATPVAL
eukprot:COSAG02_NODE_27460_length_609_cov_0.864706_1_plen_91_part_10